MDSVIGRLDSSVFSMLRNDEAPRIRICGLRRPEDAELINRLRPDFVGFIFDTASDGYVAPDEAETLKEKLSPVIKATGIFADADQDDVLDIAAEVPLDLVELHGSEDNTYINELRRKMHSRVPIIKAFHVQTTDDITSCNDSAADYVLLDSGSDTEEPFDWTLASGQALNKPFFLAGGLYPDNIKKAVRVLHPDVVDCFISTEEDSRECHADLTALINAARSQGSTFVD